MAAQVTPTTTVSVSTSDLYSRWAATYDTDGNPLQVLDSALTPSLLETLFSLLSTTKENSLTVIELGTGTGRNTSLLLFPPFSPLISHIHALDFSSAMLDIARKRCSEVVSASNQNPSHNSQPPITAIEPTPQLQFHHFNALVPPEKQPEFTIQTLAHKADIMLTTLVLEHLPLQEFFRALDFLLKPTGRVLITNMHAEMGRISRAGFTAKEGSVTTPPLASFGEGVMEETSTPHEGKKSKLKIQGESFIHEISEVLEEGKKWGFEVVGNGVIESDGLILGERGKKWAGRKMWFGMVMEKR